MLAYEAWQNALSSHEATMADLFVESPFVHPSVMFRKSQVEAVGGYRERGWPEDLILDAYSHGDTGLERDTPIRKAIFAVDEMSGFVIACALVKPDKSVGSVEPAGVRKKMKDKAFARAVHREDLVAGAELLGVPFDEHVATVRDALKPIASQSVAAAQLQAGDIDLAVVTLNDLPGLTTAGFTTGTALAPFPIQADFNNSKASRALETSAGVLRRSRTNVTLTFVIIDSRAPRPAICPKMKKPPRPQSGRVWPLQCCSI